jgi:hypothetical protein
MVPPSLSRSAKLLRGEASLGVIRAVQQILCLGEQGWLHAQKLLVGRRNRRSLRLASTMLLRVGLTLQELSQNFVLLTHQLLHCGSWRRWQGNLLVLPATLPSCHLKTEIAATVIPIHNFEQYALYHTERKYHNITSI